MKTVYINKWLLPLSWLYGLVMYIRNKLFDCNLFEQRKYDVPILCVGNITVGGTGKTPHTEYLIRLLKSKYKVAVLSRGYGRKTKGYILADDTSNSISIGDEPFQMKQKFPDILVAVDGNRRKGISNLLRLKNPPQVIILDDAYQHRYVTPTLSIVLSNFHRPVYEDYFLPAGRLRESLSGLKRADIIITSKCSENISDEEKETIKKNLLPGNDQQLFFSNFVYKNVVSVFCEKDMEIENLKSKDLLLVTGIASPKMIIDKLSEITNTIQSITYPDHYNFKDSDMWQIKETFKNIKSDDKLILVTEKDAARFASMDMDDDLKKYIYSLPISVSFFDEGDIFDKTILDHVKNML